MYFWLFRNYFVIIFPWKRTWPFIWKILNSLHSKMLFAKFGWNWPSGSGDFKISLMHFRYFIIISIWKWAWPFICTNLNPHDLRMLCAKFYWNWPSGSGEEDENVKVEDDDDNNNHDGQRTNCDRNSSFEPSAMVS